MQVLSDFSKDIRDPKPGDGSYEWWYFDGLTSDGKYSFVIIFYEGNPFSDRYLRALDSGGPEACKKASCYPALSMSVYYQGRPVYYGFTEYDPEQAEFGTDHVSVKVGDSEFSGSKQGCEICYTLRLNQQLPSGDSLQGTLCFTSTPGELFLRNDPSNFDSGKEGSYHSWNLIQPKAVVVGELEIRGREEHSVHFDGLGYHDHNTGMNPLDHHFREWYWGRFHFDNSTLVFYMMDTDAGRNNNAWLIKDSGHATAIASEFRHEDRGINPFGLLSARKLTISGEKTECMIQQEQLIDNGPFYQRFHSKVVMRDPTGLSYSSGMTEYLKPGRIRSRLFRPLVNMRIIYPGKSHWVQQSPVLYRWTWQGIF